MRKASSLFAQTCLLNFHYCCTREVEGHSQKKTAFRPKKALKNYLLLLADTLEEGKLISRLRDKSFAAASELNSPLV